jgi:hypothetical protein
MLILTVPTGEVASSMENRTTAPIAGAGWSVGNFSALVKRATCGGDRVAVAADVNDGISTGRCRCSAPA